MFSELYQFNKLVMYLNSCSMDLGRDTWSACMSLEGDWLEVAQMIWWSLPSYNFVLSPFSHLFSLSQPSRVRTDMRPPPLHSYLKWNCQARCWAYQYDSPHAHCVTQHSHPGKPPPWPPSSCSYEWCMGMLPPNDPNSHKKNKAF